MFCVNTVAEESYFTEEAESNHDADSNNNLNEHFGDKLCHTFFVNFKCDSEKHFLLKLIFSESLLVNEFLRDRCLFFSWDGSVEIIFEGLRDSFYSDDNSPERLWYFLFDLDVGASEGKTCSFLNSYFS